MVAEKVFAVIAESTRRDILEALAQESKAVGQLVDELGVSQPTVSKHLRVLREAGVVTMRAQGQKRFYGINTVPLALVSTWLDSLGAGITAASVNAVAPQPGRQSADAGTPGRLTAVASVPAAVAVAGGSAPSGTPITVAPAAAVAKTAPGRQTENRESGSSAANHPASRAAGGAAGTAAAQAPAGRAAGDGAAAMPGKSHGATDASVVPSLAVSRQTGAVVQSHDADGGMQGQISRSVGRAANKAADLLANLPALPAFRRRKD